MAPFRMVDGNEFDVYWETAGCFMAVVAIFVTESHFQEEAGM